MSWSSRLSSLARRAARSPAVRRGARDLGRAAVRAVQEQRGGSASGSLQRSGPAAVVEGAAMALADRDPARHLALSYAPRPDDHPDPGEIVWAWVPYEEDLTRGKDRPVLVLAREEARPGGRDGEGEVLVALLLTSRDRAGSGRVRTDEHGATWVDIGAGGWDPQGRESEVRADRLLRLRPEAVRREGGRLDRGRYRAVADVVRAVHGWGS